MSDKCSIREIRHDPDPNETKIIQGRKKKRESDKPIERIPERKIDYVF